MKHQGAAGLASLLISAMFVGSFWTLTRVTAGGRVPVHFDLDGSADRWMDPWPGLFLLPAVAAIVWLILFLLPRIDPRGDNIIRSSKAYGTIWLAVIALLAATHGIVMAVTVNFDINATRWITALVGALFIAMGNMFGKIRPNYTLGIRTPWTLADAQVWDKTHRFAGRLFVIGGFVLLAVAATVSKGPQVVAAILIVVLSTVLLALLKSYLLWRERERSRG
jgi:uncharacterized membrane protein